MGFLNDALKKRNRKTAFNRGYEVGKLASSKEDAKWWQTAGTTAGEFGMEKNQAFEDAVEQHEIIKGGEEVDGDGDVDDDGESDAVDDGAENDEEDDSGSESGGYDSPVESED